MFKCTQKETSSLTFFLRYGTFLTHFAHFEQNEISLKTLFSLNTLTKYSARSYFRLQMSSTSAHYPL